MKTIALNLVATLCLATLAATPASAYPGEGMRCKVKSTSDGFVALRKGPSASTQLIRKLQRPSSKSIYVDNVHPYERSNGWVFVSAVRYDPRFEEGHDRSAVWMGGGYVRVSLINWSSCNNKLR